MFCCRLFCHLHVFLRFCINMKSRSNSEARVQRVKSNQGDGPNWVLIVGGALLSTLSIRIGCKLKQAIDWKPRDNAVLKGLNL